MSNLYENGEVELWHIYAQRQVVLRLYMATGNATDGDEKAEGSGQCSA